jgi:glycerate kinase
VLIAPDKFKGTLTSGQVAHAIAQGLRAVWPRAKVTPLALADGGDGFTVILTRAAGGTLHRVRTTDALGRPCRAVWGLLPDRHTAVIDLASASGLARVPPARRDPRHTSTIGTGLLLQRVIAAGATTVIVGLGGSSSNEGGIGFAHALGWRFFDARGSAIPLTGAGLARLARIEPPRERPSIRVIAAVDVDNPLFGPRGAAHQFAAQKGADKPAVRKLDRALRRLARVVRRDLGVDWAGRPGAGAAGGCGYGLQVFLNARTEPGFEIFRRAVGLDRLIRQHDLVVTGEGSFDATSLSGKGPYRLAQVARQCARPTWGIFGRVSSSVAMGIFARFAQLAPLDVPLEILTAAQLCRRVRSAAATLGGATEVHRRKEKTTA